MINHSNLVTSVGFTQDDFDRGPILWDDEQRWAILQTELPMNWYVFEPRHPLYTPVEENSLILVRARDGQPEFIDLYG